MRVGLDSIVIEALAEFNDAPKASSLNYSENGEVADGFKKL